MVSKKLLTWQGLSLATIVCAVAGLYFQQKSHQASLVSQHQKFALFTKQYKTLDQQLYLSLPIYQDYINVKKQKQLRLHLLKDHLQAASDQHQVQVRDQTHVAELVQKGQLVILEQTFKSPYYFHNVQKKFRYLTPHARQGLLDLSHHFNQLIKARIQHKLGQQANTNFMIKFAVSSATRPVAYQRNLRGRNANAALQSSHSYGISFDIFYDEFYLYTQTSETNPAWPSIQSSKNLLGFSIGRARRRQLRAMLAEALLDLQAAGKLYAIWERNQRCYHVTILQ